MSLNTIIPSLYDHLTALVLPHGAVIRGKNTEGDLPTTPFVVPSVMPATTTPIGLRTTDKERGLMQASVFTKKNTGEIKAADIAQAIVDGFPRNLQLTGVRIDEAGSIAPSFFDDSWMITPVTIPYQNIR